MKRVNISISDEVYEALRKLAFEQKVQPGTLAAKIVVRTVTPAWRTELHHEVPDYLTDDSAWSSQEKVKP